MFGISEYLMAGSVAFAIAGGGYGFLQSKNADIANANLKAKTTELSVAQGELITCGARLQNIIDDVESDNEIDNLTDDQLTDVPAHWLLPVPTETATPAPGD